MRKSVFSLALCAPLALAACGVDEVVEDTVASAATSSEADPNELSPDAEIAQTPTEERSAGSPEMVGVESTPNGNYKCLPENGCRRMGAAEAAIVNAANEAGLYEPVTDEEFFGN